MGAGKIVRVVFGALLALLAIGLLIAGGTLLWAYETQRDADGFFTTPTVWLETDGYAIVTSEVDLASHPGDWWPTRAQATARLVVRAAADQEIFVGIAAEQDVTAYLAGVAYAQIRDISDRPMQFDVTSYNGSAPTTRPDEQPFWAVHDQGTGTRTITWDLARGTWMAVVMNADASPSITVSAVGGGRLPVLRPIAYGLLGLGLLLCGLAALLLSHRHVDRPAHVSPAAIEHPGRYPAMLEAVLDEPLSPALWLVKWFLAIPHYVVLAFLWAGFALLSVVAWIAILSTGRYPRGLFDFNVGVIRWTWRVAYYAYSGLGTDRYPPFTLQDAAYPASFSVPYPEQLSRGLALVKWWLLAIPHYIIVGALTSGIVLWSSEAAAASGDAGTWQAGIGFIGALVLVAGFSLLFTGRYPRGLFDLIMGLNRWAFRVFAYAALMTDEYPPFHLDMGGQEPRQPLD